MVPWRNAETSIGLGMHGEPTCHAVFMRQKLFAAGYFGRHPDAG